MYILHSVQQIRNIQTSQTVHVGYNAYVRVVFVCEETRVTLAAMLTFMWYLCARKLESRWLQCSRSCGNCVRGNLSHLE